MFDDATKKWQPALVKTVKQDEVTAEFTDVPGSDQTEKWPSPDKMRIAPQEEKNR